jgi:NADPH:quinone reductase-like Zn-dependent oxidoreductase
MRAVVCTRYGPPEVLRLAEVPMPTPRSRDVLVRVRATAVTVSDCRIRAFVPGVWPPARLVAAIALGFSGPRHRILGVVFAGEVVATGGRVSRFTEHEQVFGWTSFPRLGAYAEYYRISETARVARKPANASYEEAAALPYGGLLALHFLRKGGVQRGQHVLIYGASGAIGTSAVQLAKHFGATVTGVCSTANLRLVRSLGADAVIDYTKEDFATGSSRYDLVLNAVGKRKARLRCERVLTPSGKHVTVDDGLPKLRPPDLGLLRDLFEAGRFRAVIDRAYPLERIAEAHAYVDQGHKKGNVVITVHS